MVEWRALSLSLKNFESTFETNHCVAKETTEFSAFPRELCKSSAWCEDSA
jgi:hypothetical protein